MEAATGPTIFISYSHKDEACKDRLVVQLGVRQRQELLDLWDDRRIAAAEDWHGEIRAAIGRATVAVLLISADFLTSQFILGEEVPAPLQRRDTEGLHIYPIIVRPCALIAPESHHRHDMVDAHPLVRGHFGEQLQRAAQAAWREAHNRLFEHCKSPAKEYPDMSDEMAPLYTAVAHGCRAGRHQEALVEVYWKRIQKGGKIFQLEWARGARR